MMPKPGARNCHRAVGGAMGQQLSTQTRALTGPVNGEPPQSERRNFVTAKTTRDGWWHPGIVDGAWAQGIKAQHALRRVRIDCNECLCVAALVVLTGELDEVIIQRSLAAIE